MEEQYGMGDLRQFMSGRSAIFPPPNPPDLLPGGGGGHRPSLTPANHYDMVMGLGRHDMVGVGGPLHHHHHHHQFELMRSTSDAAANTNSSSAAAAAASGSTVPCGGVGGGGSSIGIGFMSALEMDGVGGGIGTGDGGNGRWPRQETLTLLEIRSRLDPKFKEANQKGPLWDEVSRIMSEEHGYQRSGKKCREKFENLYKYYKKTKEGKAGRQDGKHYRFFRQLEALYGEPSINNNVASASTASENHPMNTMIGHNSNQEVPFHGTDHSLSISNNNNSSDQFDTSSSEDSELMNDSKGRKRKAKRSWKTKIKDFIDSQMKKLMEKQEAWLEKIMKTIEQKEQERAVREEEWRKHEAARVDREHAFWANERSWIESRDSAMMEALRTLTGKEVVKDFPSSTNQDHVVAEHNGSHETINSIMKNGDHHGWPECEITRLIQLRTSMEGRFHQLGCPEEILWEEIASKMACLGYDRTPLMCKEKWDNISNYLIKCSKKRKENSRFNASYLTNEYSCDTNDHHHQQAMSGDHHHDSGNVIHDGSSYRFAMDHTENLWENYGVKFSKGNNI